MNNLDLDLDNVDRRADRVKYMQKLESLCNFRYPSESKTLKIFDNVNKATYYVNPESWKEFNILFKALIANSASEFKNNKWIHKYYFLYKIFKDDK